jgi:hypothetical protein
VKVLPEPLVELIGSSAFAVSAAPSAARYADGIPSRIKDSVVYRVNEILNLAAQSADGESPWVLIGGWYGAPTSLAPDCAAPPTQANCRTAKIADDPIQLDGQGVAIDGASPTRSGPVVIRGRAQARCTAPAGGRLMYLCLSAIHAVEIVWQGDGATDTTPIGVYDLLTSLAAAFPGFDPQPFQDTPGCSQARPLQSYRSAGGRVQLVFIFPSTESAQAAASALTGSPPGGTCISAPRAAQARWVAQDNVLLRVLGGNGPDGPTARSVLAGLSSGTGE